MITTTAIRVEKGQKIWIRFGTEPSLCKIIGVFDQYGAKMVRVRIKCGFLPLWMGLSRIWTLEEFWREYVIKAKS